MKYTGVDSQQANMDTEKKAQRQSPNQEGNVSRALISWGCSGVAQPLMKRRKVKMQWSRVSTPPLPPPNEPPRRAQVTSVGIATIPR